MKNLILMVALIALPAAATTTPKSQVVKLEVTEKGFEPSQINVKPGTNILLNVTRKTNATCATVIKIPSKKIKQDLPLNQTVKVDLGKLEKGEVRFACGMDMLSGEILVQ